MTESRLFYDRSITSLSGSSTKAIDLNANRMFLAIENTGADNIGVNLTGGAADIGGTGTITIVANGSLILDRVVPQNAIYVIGTSGQPVTIIEG